LTQQAFVESLLPQTARGAVASTSTPFVVSSGARIAGNPNRQFALRHDTERKNCERCDLTGFQNLIENPCVLRLRRETPNAARDADRQEISPPSAILKPLETGGSLR
jgi:hypothetical protein